MISCHAIALGNEENIGWSRGFRGNIKVEVALDKVFNVSDTAKVLSSLVDEVEQGSRVQLFRAGKPVAIILPIDGQNNVDTASQEPGNLELRIGCLYSEIASLEQNGPESMEPQTRRQIQTKTAELRRLQNQEAKRLHAHFDERTHLDANAAWTAIEQAQRLLDQNG